MLPLIPCTHQRSVWKPGSLHGGYWVFLSKMFLLSFDLPSGIEVRRVTINEDGRGT